MNGSVGAWIRTLSGWVLPTTCLLCGDQGGAVPNLCNGCARALPRPLPACPVCAAIQQESRICSACRRRAPPWDRAISALVYASPASYLVSRLKFGGSLAASATLGGLLADVVCGELDHRPECLIPVPLHDRRLCERGFNQAAEIARPVARRIGVRMRTNLCRRIRATVPQSSLVSAEERHRNLRGVFTLEAGREAPHHVAIVDDVMTTGATVYELARVLRRGGVNRVEIWTATRAPGMG